MRGKNKGENKRRSKTTQKKGGGGHSRSQSRHARNPELKSFLQVQIISGSQGALHHPKDKGETKHLPHMWLLEGGDNRRKLCLEAPRALFRQPRCVGQAGIVVVYVVLLEDRLGFGWLNSRVGDGGRGANCSAFRRG